MRGATTKVNLKRRSLGSLNPAGEPIESWNIVAGKEYINVRITGLTARTMASFNEGLPGLIQGSTHTIKFRPGMDIQQDDRVIDTKGNIYVIKHILPLKSHIEAMAEITKRV